MDPVRLLHCVDKACPIFAIPALSPRCRWILTASHSYLLNEKSEVSFLVVHLTGKGSWGMLAQGSRSG
jgi:hypothetical protein